MTKWSATMPLPDRGEVWMIDLGMAAKVRPALLLTGTPLMTSLQQIQTVSTAKLERRLGALTLDEMGVVRAALAKRLGF